MGWAEIKKIKEQAAEPKPKKIYTIKKVSAKRMERDRHDQMTLAADEELRQLLWKTRPHKCVECGQKLEYNKLFWKSFFHHLLEKSEYPQFRHEPDNIVLVCIMHHDQVRFGKGLDALPVIKQLTIQAEQKFIYGRTTEHQV